MPKLRLKDSEGREFPEWGGKCLEKIASIYDGVHQTPNYVETGVPFVSVENINDLENTNKFISLEDFKKDFKVYPEKDDILMTRIGDIGTSALVPKEGFAYYVSLALIKTKKNAIIPKFLNQYIKSNIFQHELYKRSLQYAFPKKINKGEIGKCVVKVPSLPEQQKIADLLTTVDHQIDIQSQRVEAMKTRKKGLLQKIFSQEIRFKNDNGQNYPEWEKKTVGSLANNIVGGGTPSTKNPAFYAGEIPWISSSDLVEDKINYLNITRFITQDAINRSATKLIPAQSVMIVCRVGVGKVAVNELPLCTSQDFMNLIVKEENSPVFIGYLLMNLMVKRRNSVQGTAIKGIPSAEIKKFKVLVPALPEQQKIADFLTTVDVQIDAEEKRLETMKTIKKGLLQQMFI